MQGINNRLRANHLRKERVSEQIDALGGDEETALEARLNELREDARAEVVETGVPRLQAAESSIGEITLPTGLGKTLTGIEAALRLREQQATDDTDSRVVYALPYTSIIEQTREILERNPKEKIPGFGLSPFSKTYTIHHYRTDTVTTQTGEEPEDTASRSAVAVAEAWRAGFTLTTFAQLFESLTGPRGTQSMKLPALSNSVVILDEPQSVPYRWWGAAARLIRLLVEEFDTTVLLMTATQPRLLDSEDSLDTVSLVESPDAYLTEAQRVTYTLDETVREYAEGGGEPLEYDTAASRLLSQSTAPSRGSTLAVCNTVSSARDLYRTVCDAATSNAGVVVDVGAELDAVRSETNQKDATDDSAVTDSLTDRIIGEVRETDEAVVVGNLTSRHTPRDRRAVLDVAGELTTADVPFIFVTTQLVEAGVDVSFQSVYRDLAPLESIVQAAGRCNRSFEWGTTGGSVVVWRLAPSRSGLNDADGNRRTPSELIYDRGQQRSLLRMVARTLIDHTESDLQFDEAALSEETLEDYFSSVHDRNYSEQGIVRDIEQTQAQSLAEASFIDDENTQDVIVPKSEAERNSLRELQETDGESFPHQMEEYTDTRISLRVPKHRRAALAAATETLDDESEVRVLTDLDSYTPAVGLRLSGSPNADDGD